MTLQPTAELTIDLGALVANYRLLQRHVKPARAGAAVKANAYGLGAAEAAPALFKVGCRRCGPSKTTRRVRVVVP